jgi:hypothetical protein
VHMGDPAGVVCAVLWGVSVPGPPARAGVRNRGVSRSGLGWSAVDGESPVGENITAPEEMFPSSSGPVESAVNRPGPPGKPEYFPMTDSG